VNHKEQRGAREADSFTEANEGNQRGDEEGIWDRMNRIHRMGGEHLTAKNAESAERGTDTNGTNWHGWETKGNKQPRRRDAKAQREGKLATKERREHKEGTEHLTANKRK
jgi:hypothetical protein